jgi:hypothetical protein
VQPQVTESQENVPLQAQATAPKNLAPAESTQQGTKKRNFELKIHLYFRFMFLFEMILVTGF